MISRTFYDTLGVKPDASAEEIKKAYRRLAAKTHPDVGGEVMAPLFLLVQEAYETLSNQARRDAYDHTLAAPVPSADRPADSAPDSPSSPDPGPRNPSRRPPAPQLPEPGERVLRRQTPRSFPFLVALWAAMIPLLYFTEVPAGVLLREGTALPSGTGAVVYGLLWSAGFACSAAGRPARLSALPLVAAAAGAAAAWGFHSGAEIPVAAHAAAGLALSVAAGVFGRRRRNLARIGIRSGEVPRTLSFNAALNAEDTAAVRRTYRSFGALLTQPGTRILEAVTVAGRPLHHLIVNGDRAAVVDSRMAPGWVRLSGRVDRDFKALSPVLPTTVVADLDGLGWLSPGRRAGWLVIHPETSGSVRLMDSSGSVLQAAAPNTAAEQLYRWFAEGDKYGQVDPEFLYRLVHEGFPSGRNYRQGRRHGRR